MTRIGVSIICVLLLTVSSIDGFDRNILELENEGSPYGSMQKLFSKKIGPTDIKVVDPISIKDLEYIMSDKETKKLPNTDFEKQTNHEKLYFVKVVDDRSNVKLPGISMKHIIVAPINCPRGFKMDALGKCRKTL